MAFRNQKQGEIPARVEWWLRIGAAAWAIAAVMLLTPPAVAQEKRLQVCDQPATRIDPIRVCGARLLDDGRVVPTTDWIDYVPRSSTAGSSLKCWDAFGNDGVSAPWGATECGLSRPEYRWYFGRDWVNPFYAGNWNKGTDGITGDSTRVEFFWYHKYGTDTFYYFLFTGRNQPGDCTYTIDYPGVAYEMGAVPQGPTWADVDLNGMGLFHTLDPDGKGSYVGMMADAWDGENVVLAQSQPMLWGANATSHWVQLAGTNHDVQLDDDNPTDQRLDPINECYSYAMSCPDPLQACVGFGNCDCESSTCNGREKLVARTKDKLGKCKVKVVLKRGNPFADYNIRPPSGQCEHCTTDEKGRAFVAEYPSRSGTAYIPACGVRVDVVCP